VKLTDGAEPTAGDRVEVEAGGRVISLSNLDRVMYPETGFTKGDLIDYYAAIAPAVLPHLKGRPLTLRRFPDGVGEPGFWEKRCPDHRPEWVATTTVKSERHGDIDYCVVDDLPTLVWTANLADIELHTSLATSDSQEHPTAMVFDLDPGAPAGVLECCEVALLLRDSLDQLGLSSRVKSSGSKGLQVYVPLDREAGYGQTKPFAHAIARLFEEGHPDLVVSRMKKSLRENRVLIDWSQNDPHKTTVCVYSMRATPTPRISAPVAWEEVEAATGSGDGDHLFPGPEETVDRFQRDGDLFEPVLGLTQQLPDLEA
jgi:bifunctional non-homologous end joining protein LigD